MKMIGTRASRNPLSRERLFPIVCCFAMLGWTSTSRNVAFVRAEFGDYADLSFECPATTTCRQICVADVTDCPSETACPNQGERLCVDGSCAVECNDDELESPCWYYCAPVACNRVVDTLDQCKTKYAELYDYEAECGAEEYEATTEYVYYSEEPF